MKTMKIKDEKKYTIKINKYNFKKFIKLTNLIIIIKIT